MTTRSGEPYKQKYPIASTISFQAKSYVPVIARTIMGTISNDDNRTLQTLDQNGHGTAIYNAIHTTENPILSSAMITQHVRNQRMMSAYYNRQKVNAPYFINKKPSHQSQKSSRTMYIPNQTTPLDLKG